jgi:hypothetical protein
MNNTNQPESNPSTSQLRGEPKFGSSPQLALKLGDGFSHGRQMTSSSSTRWLVQCTLLSSQLMKNLAMPALFFSDMNW